MNLWQIITSNSTLPIQAGTTFYDHLNNQSSGQTLITRTSEDFEVEAKKDPIRAKSKEIPLSTIIKSTGEISASATQKQNSATIKAKRVLFKPTNRKVKVK